MTMDEVDHDANLPLLVTSFQAHPHGANTRKVTNWVSMIVRIDTAEKFLTLITTLPRSREVLGAPWDPGRAVACHRSQLV
jgi:hypothetical protein